MTDRSCRELPRSGEQLVSGRGCTGECDDAFLSHSHFPAQGYHLQIKHSKTRLLSFRLLLVRRTDLILVSGVRAGKKEKYNIRVIVPVLYLKKKSLGTADVRVWY